MEKKFLSEEKSSENNDLTDNVDHQENDETVKNIKHIIDCKAAKQNKEKYKFLIAKQYLPNDLKILATYENDLNNSQDVFNNRLNNRDHEAKNDRENEFLAKLGVSVPTQIPSNRKTDFEKLFISDNNKYYLPDNLKSFFEENKKLDLRKYRINSLINILNLPKYEIFDIDRKNSKLKEIEKMLNILNEIFQKIEKVKVPAFLFNRKIMPCNMDAIDIKNYVIDFLNQKLGMTINDDPETFSRLFFDDLVRTFLSVFLVIDAVITMKKREITVISPIQIYYIVIFFNTFSDMNYFYYT
ncbi:hypothetical protein GVAV_000162 [Gurleya vavrai]